MSAFNRLWIVVLFAVAASTAQQGTTWDLVRADANPGAGFEWPYYLAVPLKPANPTRLLVVPIATPGGSDDLAYISASAKGIAEEAALRAATLGMPVLTPIIPRPFVTRSGSEGAIVTTTIYTHALTREVLTTSLPGYVRLDLQLIAMIEDARTRLAARGIPVPARVLLRGFSASAQFALRFALLHPDRVKAVSSGAPFPTLPVSEWNGVRVTYPVGIADLEDLTGQPFDLETFRQVQFQIYVGDADTNDIVTFVPTRVESFEPAEQQEIHAIFEGPPNFMRWPTAEAAYASVDANAQFLIWPKLGHNYPSGDSVWSFLQANLADSTPALPAKPRPYRFYLPYFLSGATSVALAATSETPFRGDLIAWSGSGEKVQTVPVRVEARSRMEVLPGDFTKPDAIAWLSLESDSGFIAAYAAYSQAERANRALLPAIAASTGGSFFRTRTTSELALAVLNTEAAGSAELQWRAIGADGQTMLTAKQTVAASGYVLTTPAKLFGNPAAANAAVIEFSSSRKVAVCAVESADGRVLETHVPVPDYPLIP